MDLLHRYHWPGNVRELAAMVKRLAVEAGDSSVITETQASRETGLEQSLISGDIE
jgi:transcriptional regulator with PAS, ATPase and Fis domain